MKRFDMRIAVVAVTFFVCIGTAGLIQSHSTPSPISSLSHVAAVVTGAFLQEMQLEIAGAKPPVQELRLSKVELIEESSETSSVEESEEPLVENEEPTTAEIDRKVVLIYHSHNRESWLPELEGTDKPSEAFDANVNVSLLGERMKEQLESKGIGAAHSKTDYNTAVPTFNYNYSYKYSNTTVKEAMAVHRDLLYLIDIHRDSQRRNGTTITIDGVDYAKLYFIIGQGNPNWKENEALARQIHESIEKKLPGISKGILTKGTKHGHGEYNQSVSKGSMLIEIGGVENTLEESYRTIDALAASVAELAGEAMIVGDPVETEQLTAKRE